MMKIFLVCFLLFVSLVCGGGALRALEENENSVMTVPAGLAAIWADEEPETANWEERVGLEFSSWDGVAGTSIANFLKSGDFYRAPNSSEIFPRSELPHSGNSAVRGMRLRGLLVIPADGDYRFALAADDSAIVFLGEPGGSRFTKKKILERASWCSEHDWTTQSATKSFSAGDVVWMEIVCKNNGGGEHFSLAWKRPGDSEFSVIEATDSDGNLQLCVPAPEPEDLEDLGVPRVWLEACGLVQVGVPADAESDFRLRLFEDVDGDGLDLLEEFQLDGNPLASGGNLGRHTEDSWSNVSGGSVDSFVKSERYNIVVNNSREASGDLDFAIAGTNYFRRYRTLVHPPYSGNWEFYIAGDDTATLLLSENASPFRKREIARVNVWTEAHQWTKNASQRSARIPLSAGMPYFLEILHAQAGGDANVSVAWRQILPNWCREAGAVASQSTTFNPAYSASKAIDGSIADGNFAHTNNLAGSWWQVDFGQVRTVGRVVVANRSGFENRLSNFRLSVRDADGAEIWGEDCFTDAGTHAGTVFEKNLPIPAEGQIVRIELLGRNAAGNYILNIPEVEVYEAAPNEFSEEPVVISGEFLRSPYPRTDDIDTNDLADDWCLRYGVVAGTNGLTAGDCGEYGDPDGDLVPNYLEQFYRTNPLVPSGRPGFVTYEIMRDVPGWSVDDAMRSQDVLSRVWARSLHAGTAFPSNIGDNYVRRVRGFITVPESGEYSFWISSDETSVFFLSSDERKYNKREIARVGYGAADRGVYLAAPGNFTTFPKQHSGKIALEAGTPYFFELYHKQYHAISHLQIAWTRPGKTEREPIPPECVSSFGGDLNDRDDDDLPDDWETLFGISPVDNGGFVYGDGAFGDPFETGVENREAYLKGWDPRAPALPTFGEVVATRNASLGRALSGSWVDTNFGMLVPAGYGKIGFGFPLADDGIYVLEVTGSVCGETLEAETLPVSAKVNGSFLGTRALRVLGGNEGRVMFFVGNLPPGNVEVELNVLNADLRRSFSIQEVRLRKISLEADGTLPSFVSEYLGVNFGFAEEGLVLVSPYCVEGFARNLDMTIVSAGDVSFPLSRGAGQKFFADVALPQDGSDLVLNASFESGETKTKSLSWSVFNIPQYENFTLRVGDSLRLGVAEADAEISVNGTSLGIVAAGSAVVHKFTTAGTHTVSASWTDADGETQSASAAISAIAVDLGDAMPLILNRSRVWTLENVPEELVVESAEPLTLRECPALPGARSWEISSAEAGTWAVVARAGENGGVLGAKTVTVHNVVSGSAISSVETLQVYDDGSTLAALYVFAEDFPEGGSVRVRISTAGVTFPDGSTETLLTSEDFDADGTARLLFLRAADSSSSVCHTVDYLDADGNIL